MPSLTKFAAMLLSTTLVSALQPVVIEGTDFINSVTGNRLQIVGIAYQPGGSSGYDPAASIDPLSDSSICLRDAALMQTLGINAIRVYNLNPQLNHDLCASIFNTAEIYMLLDVNSPIVGESINREAPWTTYTTSFLNRTFAVVEAFKGFPNTLAFFAGIEVIDDYESSINAPYMRSTFPTNFTLPATPSGAVSLIEEGLVGATQGKLIIVTNLTPSQKVEDHTGVVVNANIVPVVDGEVNTATRAGNEGPRSGSATTSGDGSASSSKAAGVENVAVAKGAVALGALELLLGL